MYPITNNLKFKIVAAGAASHAAAGVKGDGGHALQALVTGAEAPTFYPLALPAPLTFQLQPFPGKPDSYSAVRSSSRHAGGSAAAKRKRVDSHGTSKSAAVETSGSSARATGRGNTPRGTLAASEVNDLQFALDVMIFGQFWSLQPRGGQNIVMRNPVNQQDLSKIKLSRALPDFLKIDFGADFSGAVTLDNIEGNFQQVLDPRIRTFLQQVRAKILLKVSQNKRVDVKGLQALRPLLGGLTSIILASESSDNPDGPLFFEEDKALVQDFKAVLDYLPDGKVTPDLFQENGLLHGVRTVVRNNEVAFHPLYLANLASNLRSIRPNATLTSAQVETFRLILATVPSNPGTNFRHFLDVSGLSRIHSVSTYSHLTFPSSDSFRLRTLATNILVKTGNFPAPAGGAGGGESLNLDLFKYQYVRSYSSNGRDVVLARVQDGQLVIHEAVKRFAMTVSSQLTGPNLAQKKGLLTDVVTIASHVFSQLDNHPQASVLETDVEVLDVLLKVGLFAKNRLFEIATRYKQIEETEQKYSPVKKLSPSAQTYHRDLQIMVHHLRTNNWSELFKVERQPGGLPELRLSTTLSTGIMYNYSSQVGPRTLQDIDFTNLVALIKLAVARRFGSTRVPREITSRVEDFERAVSEANPAGKATSAAASVSASGPVAGSGSGSRTGALAARGAVKPKPAVPVAGPSGTSGGSSNPATAVAQAAAVAAAARAAAKKAANGGQ